MISAYIIDDFTLFREGIKEILKTYDSIYIAGDNTKKNFHPEKIKAPQPDIILLVQNKEDSITLKICKELSLTPFHYKILIIGDSERNQNIINLFNAGASGFVSKNASVEELFKAITSVLKGKHNFSQKIAKIMSTATHKQKTYKTELSAKEIEIVACMIEGMHNKQIAEKLNISYRTVEVHKSHIFNKLHTSNIADIIKYALQNGLYKL